MEFILKALGQVKKEMRHLFVDLLASGAGATAPVECSTCATPLASERSTQAAAKHALYLCRPALEQLASRTFRAFASGDIDDARIAVKIAECLQPELSVLGGATTAATFALALLRRSHTDNKALSPAVAILRTYPELLDELGEEGGACAGLLAEVALCCLLYTSPSPRD